MAHSNHNGTHNGTHTGLSYQEVAALVPGDCLTDGRRVYVITKTQRDDARYLVWATTDDGAGCLFRLPGMRHLRRVSAASADEDEGGEGEAA